MSASRPNLFDYGHKELSQDAVICWLLDWAQDKHRDVDAVLHDAGRRFVRALFEKHGQDAPERIHNVQLGKQVSGIDVLAWINQEYAILIEDKTDTDRHGKQLQTYHARVLAGRLTIDGGAKDKVEVRPESKDKFLPTFLKTGNLRIAERDRISELKAEAGGVLCPRYRVFERGDFLDVLAKTDSWESSPILADYTRHLLRIEESTNSWETDPPHCWSWRAWEGFFLHLECEMKGGWWGYVPNQSGGFWAFAWCDTSSKRGQGYLQIEAHPESGSAKLCFKIDDVSKEIRSQVRNEWHGAVKTAASGVLPGVKKPSRFGVGATMTVAVSDRWPQTVGDQLDLEATILKLRKAEKVLSSAAGRIGETET